MDNIKNILVIWILVQLLALPIMTTSNLVKMKNNTFICLQEDENIEFYKVYVMLWFYPMILFMDMSYINQYCNKVI